MQQLEQNEIFVFGSNTGGIHGAGAAKQARLDYGAVWGVGEGRTGKTYAIPTKGTIKRGDMINVGDTLSLDEIKEAVDRFIAHAYRFPMLVFKVTRIGCGLAGLKDSDIAPMFETAPSNCHFDTVWKSYLSGKRTYWGTF